MTRDETIAMARYSIGHAIQALTHPRKDLVTEDLWRDQLEIMLETLEQMAGLFDRPTLPAAKMATYDAEMLRLRLTNPTAAFVGPPDEHLRQVTKNANRTLHALTGEHVSAPVWVDDTAPWLVPEDT